MLRFTAFQLWVTILTIGGALAGLGFSCFGPRPVPVQEPVIPFGDRSLVLPGVQEGAPRPAPPTLLARAVGDELEVIRELQRVNVNTGDLEELCSLSGIGESTARNIMAYRETHGPFARIEDLAKVKRIGPRTVERFRGQITVGRGARSEVPVILGDQASAAAMAPSARRPRPTPAPYEGPLININTADVDELTQLPRVGQKTALRIIEYRQKHGPFATIEDITKVKGIGPKTLERFKDRITVK